jgi:hypothetical protein
MKYARNLGYYIMISIMIYADNLVLLGEWNVRGHDELGMYLGWGKQETHTELWWKDLFESER